MSTTDIQQDVGRETATNQQQEWMNATWTDDNVTGRLGGCAVAAVAVAVTIDAVVAGAVNIAGAGARAGGGV